MADGNHFNLSYHVQLIALDHDVCVDCGDFNNKDMHEAHTDKHTLRISINCQDTPCATRCAHNDANLIVYDQYHCQKITCLLNLLICNNYNLMDLNNLIYITVCRMVPT